MLTPWKENYDQPRQHIEKERHYFANKGPSSQGYGFCSGHVWMWELDYKERIDAFELWCWRRLLSPLDSREIKPVNPKGNQSWIFKGRTDAEAEAPILWPPWREEPTHSRRPWFWERLRAGGEGDNRGWDGWMALLTQWTRVGASSGRWWRTGQPGALQSAGLQRVRHNWATEQHDHFAKLLLFVTVQMCFSQLEVYLIPHWTA